MTNSTLSKVGTSEGDRRVLEVRHMRHPMRWVSMGVILLLLAMLAKTLITNERFQWDVVWQYFTSESILSGLGMTLYLTAVSMILGVIVGVILALMRLARDPITRGVAGAYVWFFRGTPILVQILFFYNISALYPEMSIGIPFGPQFISGNVNNILTPLLAAIIALGLNEAAFMSEIIKAGILSVPSGQTEAGKSLGMSPPRVFLKIVLPQAMRFIVPPSANQIIAMLKNTSIVSVIALQELLYSAQIVYTRDFNPIPLLLVASIWYLIVTTVLTLMQSQIEDYYAQKGRRVGIFAVPRMLRGTFERRG